MPEESVSRRVEGPTPNGGAYSVGYFFRGGLAVPQRYADRMLIVEYDEDDRPFHRTWGHTTPREPLPEDWDGRGTPG
ncbi:hypothetical protein [Actinocorallia aurantiaca]|jgi:hypothetical protein|uniref:Uncharacterized protein n=1 Tax=Actinocorallia aurantiaca TaxID=46204 RepID=A0ABN3UPS4_9ACTN